MEIAIKKGKGGVYTRPLQKSVISWFDDKQVGFYGGRKGFTDLMLSYGQSLEDVSMWTGHTKVDRTWKSYKNKNKVSFKKVAA